MEWRVIKDFPNYSVSEFGDIRNNETSKILAWRSSKKGYVQVVLCWHGEHKYKYVHRLVAEAFIPNSLNKPEVNHIDGNKKNNSVNNLEWVTSSENKNHLYNVLDSTDLRKRLGMSRKGEKNSGSRKVVRIEDGKVYSCITDAARDIGVHRMCVSDVCRGVQKTTKGYHYKYLDDFRGTDGCGTQG